MFDRLDVHDAVFAEGNGLDDGSLDLALRLADLLSEAPEGLLAGLEAEQHAVLGVGHHGHAARAAQRQLQVRLCDTVALHDKVLMRAKLMNLGDQRNNLGADLDNKFGQ